MEIISLPWLTDYRDRVLERWELARNNYEALGKVTTRILIDGERQWVIQRNPERHRSSGADLSQRAIKERDCFLCAQYRPSQQLSYPLLGGRYELLVNPFPIFPLHFTIPYTKHVAQQIAEHEDVSICDMAMIAAQMPGMVVFYNGAKCGASAPDHFHFQAIEASRLPLFQWLEQDKVPFRVVVRRISQSRLSELSTIFADVCKELKDTVGVVLDEVEPRFNLYMRSIPRDKDDNDLELIVLPRLAHRPSFYGLAENQMMFSPASIDLGGVIILPREQDFNNFSLGHLQTALSETTLTP